MSESYSLISAREHYLSIPVIENFCRYLACYLNGRTFDPAYTTETLRPKVHYCLALRAYLWVAESVRFGYTCR